ncbi:Uncharacterised protein [uncultured archaeon]|nr:Uncharacterised protein [uncultured archaeon]
MDIDSAFRGAFTNIFGQCNIGLDELEGYLTRYHYPVIRARSSISGKEVVLSSSNYPKGAVISQDEISSGKPGPLHIDDIKDLDSLIGALEERFGYAGNKVFGNSADVRESDNVVDSICVYRSHNIFSSRYVAYSSYVRDNSEFIFGSSYFFGCRNTISVVEAGNLSRAFECYLTGYGSDLFFCYNCFNTSNAMFCFNQKTKKYVIGNSELHRDKYLELRKKLLDESREYIEKNKTFYSIFDFHGLDKELIKEVNVPARKPRNDENLKTIEDAFNSTTRIIFGKELGPVDKCAKMLGRRIIPVGNVKTPFGSQAHYLDMFFYRNAPKERMVNSGEAWELGKLKAEIADGEKLETIAKKLAKIAFYRVDWYEGTLSNIMQTRFALNSANTYKVADAVNAKDCAYDTMAFDSESIFGCFRAIHSRFSINCHDCVNVTGCFEMDSCNNCSSSMFCHNSENLDNCMFCFNAKSKRYAIGNVEAGRENYLKIKKLVVEELRKRIEVQGEAGLDIYDLRA